MRRKVKEDGCFSTHMGRVQKSNLSVQDSSNQNRDGRSQSKGPPPESAQQYSQNMCYNQVPGPLVARKLHEVCFQWLMPETSFKEPILESLMLEQFLSILPRAMKNWMQKHHPRDVEQTVSLVEGWQTEPDAVPDTGLLTFDDIDMHFSEKEWRLLSPSQKTLYRDEMLNIYKMAASLGNDAFFHS
ncbi:Zinc finger protein 75D [Lemmus lemmus]